MKKHHGLKMFMILLISTLFIYSFSHIGAMAYNSITTNNDLFLSGTLIGSIDVSEKSTDDALNLITEQVEKWQEETVISLIYKEKEVPLNLKFYQFDLQNSVDTAQSGKKNALISSIDSNVLREYLDTNLQGLSFTEEEMNSVLNELIHYGEDLIIGKHVVSIDSALATKQPTEIVNEFKLELPTISIAMADWVSELSPIHVPANSQVSFLDLMDKHELTSVPAGVMSMIASGLYATILPTNFEIIERHISQELPEFVDLGREARINRDNHLDLIFANPNEQDFTIELTWDYHALTVQLTGESFLYNYKIDQTDKQEYKPKTIVQYSPQLLPVQTKVLEEGKVGSLIRVLRKVYDEQDQLISEELISEDFYAPIEKVVVRGLKQTNTASESNQLTDENNITNPSEPKLYPEMDEQQKSSTKEQNSSTRNAPIGDTDLWGKPNEQEK